MILLFSHKLSDDQRLNAESIFGIREFVVLPEELQKIWSGIDPDEPSVKNISKAFQKFLLETSQANDVVLVQGDFGMVYNMVHFCKQNRLIPVYATTKRNAIEYTRGNKSIKKSIFEFRRFREYE